ncbi:putative Vacuolar-processing enzyme alpha-isozyme [Blattamonas nauphoetae]|uniref:Vacuolar-processing enzyme alpha-isozyme n=1 Tax=Blattamonas nauphoetae TaxID=2049346 RepID=A0ABQ9YL05_9EUKA|nr:putative Vacuolar-processing enzyme alpha-isozyme [Blattamonas nauphoetae]
MSQSVYIHINGIEMSVKGQYLRSNWAVLVAGSSSIRNYRHQSDVFHAYQLLTKKGFQKERIILMAYNDVIDDEKNPFPGKMFNSENEVNVYPGKEAISYTGTNVTKERFLAVLSGNKEKAGGPVVESKENDDIFVFYSDHGSPGVLLFPASASLHGDELVNTLIEMHTQKKYRQMVIYVEACYSGSMFHELLPKNISVFALTAANEKENSWAQYCYDDGPFAKMCLGDEMACHWMEHSEKVNLQLTTVKTQAETVKKLVELSHVQQFGDKAVADNVLAVFQQGDAGIFPEALIHFYTSPSSVTQQARVNQHRAQSKYGTGGIISLSSTLSEFDPKIQDILKGIKFFESAPHTVSHLRFLNHRAQRSNEPAVQAELQTEIEHIVSADHTVHKLLNYLSSNTHRSFFTHILPNSINFDRTVNQLLIKSERATDPNLYRRVLNIYHQHCGFPSEYETIPIHKILANACNQGLFSTEKAIQDFNIFLENNLESASHF